MLFEGSGSKRAYRFRELFYRFPHNINKTFFFQTKVAKNIIILSTESLKRSQKKHQLHRVLQRPQPQPQQQLTPPLATIITVTTTVQRNSKLTSSHTIVMVIITGNTGQEEQRAQVMELPPMVSSSSSGMAVMAITIEQFPLF